jgi:hypothetical protein
MGRDYIDVYTYQVKDKTCKTSSRPWVVDILVVLLLVVGIKR